MDIKEFLKNEYILLDGAMGTMLQAKGMPLGTIPETLNIEKPEWIIDVHRRYIENGSNVVYANTFGANRLKMAASGYTVAELVGAAIQNARKAAEGTGTKVALDIGPIGQLLEPTGALSFEEAYDIFAETVEAGREADLIVIETMTDLYETKAAVLAAKEHSDLPVFVTMTFEENKRTFTGCSVSAMCLTLEGLGVDALGVNCSLGPADLLPIVEEIARWTSLPIIVKPNA
ncbi:MAG: homocysteine S-methyltransferase family protein, partial [Lachnospiraceae bacterium]|nr:homocysteine S-methyltransferase family protein [Lachnospiraceae bacterium]